MSNLSKALRERLAELPFGGAEIYEKRVSQKDGTVKYLFALDDGNMVEGVLMRYKYGNTLCLSTQVGCRMGCAFCASTLEGRVRDLSSGEMLAQVAAAERDAADEKQTGRAVTNLVLMGSGEPLDNYDNTVRFLRRVSADDGMGISVRNISLSTCGLVPQMRKFIREGIRVTLSVSLHAHDNDTRTRLMPVNRTYPIEEVLDAAREYASVTGRRVIFEYALIDGVNASREDAAALARRLRGMPCHVNLIPLNAVPERALNGATRAQAAAFEQWLTQKHISATVRREMGADIEGACGQLRRRVLQRGKD
jgi:23S rRNA (adenine2503-C2)-methyltransferase